MKTLKLLSVSLILTAFVLIQSCKKEEQNTTPAATCTDGIQNQGETGVDCGGPCAACLNTTMSCKIDGAAWTSVSTIYGGVGQSFSGVSSDGKRITLGFQGTTTGTYDLGNLSFNQAAYVTGSTVYNSAFGGSGSIIVTSYANKVISGTFSFTGSYDQSGTPIVTVTNGVFTDVKLY